jgi:hypothetical protein
LLEKLKRKFADQRLVLEKEEMNSKASYEVLNQQLTDDIKANKEAVSAKTATKASRLEAAAQAKGDKAVTETTKSEDEKTLSDTNAKCRAKAEEFENNQVVRREELTAISKAIEIISSDKVKGTGAERLPSASLVQTPKKKHAFAQLRSSVNEAPEARQRAIEYLQRQAAKLNSRYLSVVAAHTEADPFVKVKKMIKDLLTKLMEEANSEADHNGYCTTELATNKQTREIKSSEVDELSAKIESETATSSRLSDEITNLADSLSEIKGKRSEATTCEALRKSPTLRQFRRRRRPREPWSRRLRCSRTFTKRSLVLLSCRMLPQTSSPCLRLPRSPTRAWGPPVAASLACWRSCFLTSLAWKQRLPKQSRRASGSMTLSWMSPVRMQP